MSILYFPRWQQKFVKYSYYQAYFLSVKRSAVEAGIKVIETVSKDVWCCPKNAFSCILDDVQFIMDFSDLKPFQLNPSDFPAYFKWHFSYDYDKHYKDNVFPLCILQDYDWKEFYDIQDKVAYTANTDLITNNQRIRAAATVRRTAVRYLLNGLNISTEFKPQKDWWMSHNNCLVAVHVPGARNDMLDRGQLELMGLGVCVISPTIVTVLAQHKTLVAFQHYIPVHDDYSNLLKTIEWCKSNREVCIEIGKKAQELFNEVATPRNYWSYIKKCLVSVSH